MLALSNARRLARSLKPSIILTSSSDKSIFISPLQASNHFIQQCNHHTIAFSGAIQENCYLGIPRILVSLGTSRMLYSTEASVTTEAVKELYDTMVESAVTKRTMPPNAWLWSLIEKSENRADIKLLFDVLQKLRVFRLSNLRIHADFNCHLCQEIAKACTRVGAIDYGKKTLLKHNLYGVAPNIASANYLLTYAKTHKDANLMKDIMKLIKRNGLELKPSTADLVFSICHDTDEPELFSKYSNRFLKNGVKLRQTAFDLWMNFAARRGDTDALWRIEELRSQSMKPHTPVSGFSCAKGFLLECKPEDAASLIRNLNQTLPDSKKQGLEDELQKLVNEWPLEVIKRKKEDDRKALAASLESDIPTMVKSLLNDGLRVTVTLKNLTENQEILC